MSKFFNETQKANEWARQRLANQGLDVRQLLESIKQETVARTTEARMAAPLSQPRPIAGSVPS